MEGLSKVKIKDYGYELRVLGKNKRLQVRGIVKNKVSKQRVESQKKEVECKGRVTCPERCQRTQGDAGDRRERSPRTRGPDGRVSIVDGPSRHVARPERPPLLVTVTGSTDTTDVEIKENPEQSYKTTGRFPSTT